MEEEQSAIEVKQNQHLQQYRQQREGLDHLSWRQRKSALYKAYKNKLTRPSERTQSGELKLPIIIKGTGTALQVVLGRDESQPVDTCLQVTWTGRWRPS